MVSATEFFVLVAYMFKQYFLSFFETTQAPATPSTPATLSLKRNYGWTSRASWLFVASLTWVFLFSMKKNSLSLATGIAYDRLQKLHRGIAIISLSMALVCTSENCG